MLRQEDRLRGSSTHPLSVGACARERFLEPQYGALAMTREESYEEGKVHPVRETAGMRVTPLQVEHRVGGRRGCRSLQGCSHQRCSLSISFVPTMCHLSEGCGRSSFSCLRAQGQIN